MSDSAALGGRFEIGDLLGQGGMGTVYRGVDTTAGQPVAIKLLKPELIAADPHMVERFGREGTALRQLNHPNIVKVLATLQSDGQHYLVMEFVDGGSLYDLLQQERQLPVNRALAIALELADALSRAHHLKIIHRDIKPANVLLAADGTPRLTDFGVAQMGGEQRITETGAAVGTMDYLSPEALNSEAVDARSDIWAFGVMLYEMLAGARPFASDTLTGVISAILTRPVPDLEAVRPDAPTALVDLIYRMLEKDLSQRIPSVRQVGAELEAILQGHDTSSIHTKPVAPAQSAFDTPTPATDAPQHNLPAQTTPFVGREHELTELANLLAKPTTRLVTLLAPGGMGKTRLALETAQTLLNNSPHHVWGGAGGGVYFVALAPLTSPDFIVSAVADAVGFQFYPGGEPKQQLLDYFREKSLLLVMDNFEHLLDGAGIVAEILAAAPGVKVLATSRERLNLSGETLYALSGMDFPNWETPEDALNYAAVKLFMQSARRARPDFELTGDDLTYLARICRLVAGMPLGIVLAAAWVEMLSLKEIANEIESSLDFLETELRDIPERQRSIRGVFEYSWNRLSDDERTVFKKLSVFRGGFTREAAQVVAGASLKTLASLVNKSLLRRDPNTGRYEVHELLRQYGEQQLQALGEMATTDNAHCAYFTEFMHQRLPDIYGRRQLAALDEIEADFANVRAAWEFAVHQKNLITLDRMVDSLYWYVDMRGRFLDVIDLFQAAVTAVENDTDDDSRRVWGRLAVYMVRVISKGDLAHAENLRTILDTALTVAQSQHDQMQIAFCLSVLSTYIVEGEGNSQAALPIVEESLALYRQLDVPYRVADVLVWRGVCYERTGHLELARADYEDGVALRRTIGDLSGLAWALQNLFFTHYVAGNITQAENCAQESLSLMRQKRDPRGILWVTCIQTWLQFWKGDFEKFGEQIQGIIDTSISIRHLLVKGIAQYTQALWRCIVEESYAAGMPVFLEMLATNEQFDFQPVICEAHLTLSFASYGLGNYVAAMEHYQAAVNIGALFPVQNVFLLGIHALHSVHTAKHERAAEFIALIDNHPRIPENWRTKWALLNRVRAQLQADLPPDVYAAAVERGNARDLDATVRELLAETN